MFYPVAQIIQRHTFLRKLLGSTKPKEDISYENALTLLISTTVCMTVFCLLEAAFYFLYNYQVSLKSLDKLLIYHYNVTYILQNIHISQFHPWKNIFHYSVEAGDKNETIEGEVKEEYNNDS